MNKHLALLWFMLRVAASVGLSVTGLLLVVDGIGPGPAILLWCVGTGLGLFIGRILGFRKGFRRATKLYMNSIYPRLPQQGLYKVSGSTTLHGIARAGQIDYVSAYPPEFTRTGEWAVMARPTEDGEAAFLAYLDEFEPDEAKRKNPWLELTADTRAQWRSIARAAIKNHENHSAGNDVRGVIENHNIGEALAEASTVDADTYLDTNAEATQANNFVDRVKAHQAKINQAIPMTDHRSI